MTNGELVERVQAGERDALPPLWTQVERFVAKQAKRQLILSGGLGGIEFGDLYNSGYLALIAAADTYDPAAGCSFIGWLSMSLKTAFAEAGGYRSRKQALDPLHRAGSLRAYPQISNCGIIAIKGGGKNGRKELQVMDNIRCVLGGHKG